MEFIKPGDLNIKSDHEDEVYVFIDMEPIKKLYYLISNYGNIYSIKSNKLLKFVITEKGYAKVTLQIDDEIRNQKCFKIHRIVAYHFCENSDPDNLVEVDHIDCKRLNNYYKNLEWVTHEENIRRAKMNGNMIDKNTEEFIRSICDMFSKGISIFDIYYNFHPDEMGKIKKLNDKKFYNFLYLILMGKRHTYIRSQYDIDIEKVKSKFYKKNLFNVSEILQKIKEGYGNIEIMNHFGYSKKDDNPSLYKRIITIRKSSTTRES